MGRVLITNVRASENVAYRGVKFYTKKLYAFLSLDRKAFVIHDEPGTHLYLYRDVHLVNV